jgi:hypothetical protein
MHRPLASCLVLGLVVASCSKPPEAPAPVGLTPARSAQLHPERAPLSPHRLLAASALNKLPAGASGPYLAMTADHGLVVLATPGAGGEVTWQALALDAAGKPRGEAHAIGPAPGKLSLVSLRPAAGGYVLLWAHGVEGGQQIEALSLDEKGAPRGKTVTVFQGAEAPLWVEAVGLPQGTQVFFALRSGQQARLHAVALDAAGAVAGATQVILDGALAWQPVATRAGSLLVAVIAGPGGTAPGTVVAAPLDEKGQPGSRLIVEPRAVADLDLEAVSLGDRVAVGWSEHAGGETRARLVALGPDGKIVAGPSSPLRSAGDHSLISLVASTGPVPRLLVTWDDLALRPAIGRTLRLTTLGPELKAPLDEASLMLGTKDETPPFLQGTPTGFAALGLVRACPPAGCPEGAPVWPTFLDFTVELEPHGQVPLLLTPLEGAAPDLAWGLACSHEGCAALATDAGSPPTAYVAQLARTDEAWAPALRRPSPSASPAAMAIDTLARGPRIAEVGAARLGATTLLVSVSDQPEGAPPPPLPPDVDKKGEADKDRAHARDPRKIAGRGAIVSVLPLDEKGQPTSPQTISVRALSAAGVALAAETSGASACVAWVARDNGDPEIFLTRVGPDGKRQAQQTLTHAKGDIGDVALAAVDDGWIIAWVDTRDGNGEVYAARVDHNLRRKGPEQRITNAPGDASDLALLVRERTALVAFSDARSSPRDGIGDVFVARLKLDDASRIGEEVRLAATPDHGRNIHLDPIGQDTLVSWVEQPGVAVTGDRPAQLQLAFLDPSGALRSLPEPLTVGPRGPISSVATSCEATGCRFVLGLPDGEGLQLSGFVWTRGDRQAAPRPLASLFAGPSADVTPVILGDQVFLGDDGPPGEGRLRRVSVRWK